MKTETCAACRHFHELDAATKTESAFGECWLNPPVIYGTSDDDVQIQGRPYIYGSEYCGKFAARMNA